MNINWYPGHMKKTMDKIQELIYIVDVIYELVDARIPYSSSNPKLHKLIQNKPKIVLFNKYDMADEVQSNKWIEYFKKQGIHAIAFNAKDRTGLKELSRLTKNLISEKENKNIHRGVKSTTSRFMIVGVPNVGKSTLINNISKKSNAKTGNKPGITKSNQWIKTKLGMELLDTPGVLWPKLESERSARMLAYTSAIKDELLDMESLAFYFLQDIYPKYPKLFHKRYGFSHEMEAQEMMEYIGRKSGKLIKGGDIDYTATAKQIIGDFRSGKLGRITLEWCNE